MKQGIVMTLGRIFCGICTLPMATEYEDCNIAPYGQEPNYIVREIYPAYIQSTGHSGIRMPLCPYCYDRMQDFIAEEKDKAIAWGKGIVPCSVGLDSTE